MSAHALLYRYDMRPRSLIVDTRSASPSLTTPNDDRTYESVRRTLDDALAELELEIDLEENLERFAPRACG
jgi:hypothetical protein